MKYCIYCGNALPDTARFCSKCGKSQEYNEEPAPVSTPTSAPVRQVAPVQAPVAPAPAPVQQAAPVQSPATPAVQQAAPVQSPATSAPAPVQQAAPVQSPATPASAPVQQAAPVQVPIAPATSRAKGLKYAEMRPVYFSMQNRYYKPTVKYTPPPYVLAPEDEDQVFFMSKHPNDITRVSNAWLNDLPLDSYNTNATLEVCSDYFRITIMFSLILAAQWEWVALTFDSIRSITLFTNGRREGAIFEFVDPECHPLKVCSKSKHFPELINRIADYAGISVQR